MKLLLPASVFLAVFMFSYLMREFPTLPQRFQYLPDLVIALVAAVVILRLVVTRRFGSIPLRYWLVSLGFIYVVASGVIINAVEPDVTFAGVRFYFKYIPLFLIPFAYTYSEADGRRLFVLLSGLALIQVPETLRQRFSDYTDDLSGDAITGTLNSSTTLSLFLVGMIIMVAALYIDKRVTFKTALPLALLFLLPATINETKITPLAMGAGVLGVLFLRHRALNSRQMTMIAVGGLFLLGAFVVVYDRLYTTPDGSSFVSYMSKKENVLDSYNLKGVRAKPFAVLRDRQDIVGEPARFIDQETWIGRLDSVRMPFDVLLAADGVRFMFGLGVGSVSSKFGSGGKYAHLDQELGATHTTITQMVWETGLIGALFGALLLLMLARDAMRLARTSLSLNTFATGWFGIAVVLICTLAYTNLIPLQEVTCLVAFFSGLVVATLQTHMTGTTEPEAPSRLNERATTRASRTQPDFIGMNAPTRMFRAPR